MNKRMLLLETLIVTLAVVSRFAYAGVSISSATSGNWNSTLTWTGGVVPTASQDVVIVSGHTVTLDVTDAACANLSIDGTLQFATDGTNSGIAISGSLSINPTGLCRVSARSPAGVSNSYVAHTLTLGGNLTNAGTLDCRAGSNSAGTANGIELTFSGSTNSTITLQSSTYQSGLEEFNAITINKTGGAKVILASGNLFSSNNSTTGAAILTLTSGLVETGANSWVVLSTSSAGVTGASSASYVNGTLGRGMATSAGTNRKFDVGDANGYRPINVHSTGAVASGGYVKVGVIIGNANTGSSVLNGGITNVSAVRYYQVVFQQGTSITTSVPLDIFSPSYGADDGVVTGNTDLRVAYSSDDRVNWNGITQSTPHTTDLTTPPTTITPDALGTAITLTSGAYVHVALGTVSTANPLPIQLASFTATSLYGSSVRLNWATVSEVNNYGFYVQKRQQGEIDWLEISGSFLAGHGTTNEPQQYAFSDGFVTAGSWQYRLRQVDLNGAMHFTEPVRVDVLTGLKEAAPLQFALQQNYPNPFNPATEVRFSVEKTEKATLEVFNIVGEKVAMLFNDVAEAGKLYNIKFNGENLATGVYLYRLQSGLKTQLKRMVLLK